MKNLNLNALGVQEMNAEEMRNVNGGILAAIAGILAFCVGFLVGVVIANEVTEN